MSETRAHAGGTKIIVVCEPRRIIVKVERPGGSRLPLYETLTLDHAEARALIEALMVEVG